MSNMQKTKKTYDYLIVGSGIFGATVANLLTQQGKKCLVVEKRDEIGGNLYCESIEGISVHKYGAHIFHTSIERVWNFVNQFCQFNNYINSPIAVYRDEVYNLPFNMNTFFQMFKSRDPNEVKRLIDADKLKENGNAADNLESQAVSLVGNKIYEKLIKGYTEKQWGKKCTELPSSIIKRLPLRFTFNNNYFNDRYQGIPIGGYNALIKAMLESTDVLTGIDYLEMKSSLDTLADKVVYTGQIDKYFNYCYGELEYRSVRFETEVLDVANYQGCAVVNYTDTLPEYTRVIEHKHFEKLGNDVYDNPKTVISREYSQKWNRDLEPYYPVNDAKNAALYEKYHQLAQQEAFNKVSVVFGGRLGEYKYYDMDKTVDSAFRLVEVLQLASK